MILLDTHALVWLMLKPKKLSRAAGSAIRRARANGGIGIAAISLWELAWLYSLGRVKGRGAVETWLRAIVEAAGVTIVPITSEIAALATQFPEDFPHDPADRLIAATARSEGLALVTRDVRIRQCTLLKTIW